tara:strand:+ start:2036 stop:3160 length:1125 start_codon:yes stop_codon:yes gene_type:complete
VSDLDRLVALAGLATDDVAQGATNETTIEESDCDCDCGKSPCESCGKDHHDVKEAVGEAAELFYEMQDMYAGGECPSKPHETIIDELVRYLSGDQIEDFVMEFRRHHMDLGDEMFKDDVNIDEDDLDENAFNQAAAAAARAGKEEFEFNGKTYKTKMDKDTAHKLDEKMRDSQEYVKKLIGQYDENDPEEAEIIEMIKKAYAMSNANPEKAASALGDTDLSDALKNAMMMDQLLLMNPEAVRDIKKEYERAGGDFSKMDLGKDLDYVQKQLPKESEEVVAEAPTMDTTQLITLLKNAGLSEEAIEEKLTEWANTPAPEMASEQEPTEHGDAYDFAQGVNLSLKRYLDAEDMKVGLKEHTVEELKAAYKASKDEG